MNIGDSLTNLKKQSVEFDPNLVAQGLKDSLSGGKTRLTVEEAQAVLKEVQQAKMQEMSAKNKSDGEAFLAANKTKEGVVTLPSGLQYKILNAEADCGRHGRLQLPWNAY
jgi:FKBP-type peptidyl-prolyl cis-trans isomerase FklB